LQLSPHTEPTSLTQIESHRVLQQYESTLQIFVTHASQPDFSFVPVLHSECVHVVPPPPPLHDSPHTLATSPTQMLSHAVVQQYESTAQISVAHGSHPVCSTLPVEQIGCGHDPPVVHVPAALHVVPFEHDPHVPPQPSGPQVLPLQFGTHWLT
jgi:hypothetical protein